MKKWMGGLLGATLVALISGLAWLAISTGTARAETMTVYKTPWCGCCTAWVKHLQRDGFEVRVIEREDLAPVRASLSVPDRLASCHTAEIRRLMSERPDAAGLSVPGMPLGSPGMEMQGPPDAYDVILFGSGTTRTYSSYVGRFPASEASEP